MKILIITQKIDMNDDILGFFHRWVAEFSKHCEQVVVVALVVGAHSLPLNVRVCSLGKESGVSRLSYLYRFYGALWRERKNYDVVFVHMNPVYVILGGIPWRFLGKKISLWYTHKHVDIKLRIAEVLVHTVFTASIESFRLPSTKVQVVGHGIDTSIFKPDRHKKESTTHLVTIGRISPVKNYEVLIDAGEVLLRERFQFDIRIIGDVALKAEQKYLTDLKASIDEKGLSTVVVLLGSVPNRLVSSYLIRADIFVNMSETGSLDKAVLEAMACGVPVLTSNVAFMRLLGDDAHMLIFRAGDVSDFASKIKELSRLDDRSRQKLTERLRSVIIGQHNLEVLIPRILSIYEAS